MLILPSVLQVFGAPGGLEILPFWEALGGQKRIMLEKDDF